MSIFPASSGNPLPWPSLPDAPPAARPPAFRPLPPILPPALPPSATVCQRRYGPTGLARPLHPVRDRRPFMPDRTQPMDWRRADASPPPASGHGAGLPAHPFGAPLANWLATAQTGTAPFGLPLAGIDPERVQTYFAGLRYRLAMEVPAERAQKWAAVSLALLAAGLDEGSHARTVQQAAAEAGQALDRDTWIAAQVFDQIDRPTLLRALSGTDPQAAGVLDYAWRSLAAVELWVEDLHPGIEAPPAACVEAFAAIALEPVDGPTRALLEQLAQIDVWLLDLDNNVWHFADRGEAYDSPREAWWREHAPRTAAHYTIRDTYGLQQAVLADMPHLAGRLGEVNMQCLRRALAECGDDPDLAYRAHHVFYRERNDLCIAPAAQAGLHALHAAGDRLFGATSGDGQLLLADQACGSRIAPLFDGCLSGAFYRARKPEEDYVAEAVRRMETSRDQTAIVGDSWKDDVGAARNAQLRAAVWTRGPVEPDVQSLPNCGVPVLSVPDVGTFIRYLQAVRNGAL
jgi:FMN phosphatase YigB (HAD superfamily)